MKTTNIDLVYFSATYTTKKVVKTMAEQLQATVTGHDITQHAPEKEITVDKDGLLLVGVPVYAGRIPAEAAKALTRLKGNETPAIIVCVYGNRDYDDALLELKDIVEGNGFKVISAGAFIAQHSIFPAVGSNRPDQQDMAEIREFADRSAELLKSLETVSAFPEIVLKGNRPYKVPGKIPLQPKGDKKCNECGTCVKLCPVQAISAATPRKTDKSKCIACGRCIVVCPQKARHFGGLLYKLADSKFTKDNSVRKQPETAYVRV